MEGWGILHSSAEHKQKGPVAGRKYTHPNSSRNILQQCRLKAQYDYMQLQALLIRRMPWANALVNWHARFQLLVEVIDQ